MKTVEVIPVAIRLMDGTFCPGKKREVVKPCKNKTAYRTESEAIAAAEQELNPIKFSRVNAA